MVLLGININSILILEVEDRKKKKEVVKIKTNELIEELKDLGLTVKNNMEDSTLLIKEGEEIVSVVDTKIQYSINTRYQNFIELDEEIQDELFTLLLFYSQTPTEEREPKEFYFLKLREVPVGIRREDTYLKISRIDKEIKMGNLKDVHLWKTTFSKQDIDFLNDEVDILKDYKPVLADIE